ncbi:MAG: succinate dehydrogenase iron-sulfur subunit [Candidatus Micrarchaeaceae archaeon]
MMFIYAALVGVPVLLYIRIFALLYGMQLVSRVLLALAALGLIAFGAVGFIEVYAHRRREGIAEISIPAHTPAVVHHHEVAHPEIKPVNFRINRFDPETKSIKQETHRLNVDKNVTVLSALLAIKDTQDPTLAVRYSCRMGICGSCGMVINGKPSLACETNVFEKSSDGEIIVEPMYGHPLIKDLVTDFDDFFEKHISVQPGLYRNNKKEKYGSGEPYALSREDIDRFLPYSYCIMCGLCLDACPVVNSNQDFVGPQALSQLYRYYADKADQKGIKRLLEMDTVNGIWGCEFAGACSKVCPKGVDPAGAIQLLKGELMKKAVVGEGEAGT